MAELIKLADVSNSIELKDTINALITEIGDIESALDAISGEEV